MSRRCLQALRRRSLRNPILGALTFAITVLLFCAGVDAQQYTGSVHYANITGQATTTLKPAPGILHVVCLNNPTATEVITLWDSLTAANAKIGTITIPTSPQPVCLKYDVNFNVGLTVQTATASSDLTIGWE